MKIRHRAGTALNAQSSRSHCLLYIQLVKADGCTSQLVLVDLAGAEKVKRTNANQERLLRQEMDANTKRLPNITLLVSELYDMYR